MIHIQAAPAVPEIPDALIERTVKRALAHEQAAGDLSVVLTDDAQLQQLNRDYLGIDAPTDVLSFPASETDPQTGAAYLGDILISVPRARLQARAAGHPLEAEVQLLAVHGLLHLLGYDHSEPADKARMWQAQAEILASLGLAGITIAEN